MAKNYNPNLIKTKHVYSFTEISETLKIHTGTVQNWHKQGLKVIDETSKPYLAYGAEFIRFLNDKRQKQKNPLKTGEFFCPKCRKPRKSLPENYTIEITEKRLGKIAKQAFIRGICEVCNQPLLLFSSDRKVQELKPLNTILAEHNTNLLGSGDSSCNTGLGEVENAKN